MKNLPIYDHNQGIFSHKLGHFFPIFEKGQGRPNPLPPLVTRLNLILTDPCNIVINCVYLRTNDRHFRDQGNVRYPTSKLFKCDLVQTVNIFRNPSLHIFAARKALFTVVFRPMIII